jgi:hypothetical protein
MFAADRERVQPNRDLIPVRGGSAGQGDLPVTPSSAMSKRGDAGLCVPFHALAQTTDLLAPEGFLQGILRERQFLSPLRTHWREVLLMSVQSVSARLDPSTCRLERVPGIPE